MQKMASAGRILSNLSQKWFKIVARYGSTSASAYIPRRALLYVPASTEKMMNKVHTMQADCVVLELEDGVALTSKDIARENVRKYLDNMPETLACQQMGVRVNAVSSGLIEDDLKAVSQANFVPDAFMVPKVDSVEELKTIWRLFTHYYGKRLAEKEPHLIMWIESGRALIDMPEIVQAAINMRKASPCLKLEGLVFGSDDYCADIGATRSSEGMETLYARQRFVSIAKCFGLQAIDSVYIDIKDTEGLRKQCNEGHSWGFTGKQVIHPSQVPIVHECFLPSPSRIDWAIELISKFEEHEKSGSGAFTFRGNMIDRPLLLQAQNVVDLVHNKRIWKPELSKIMDEAKKGK